MLALRKPTTVTMPADTPKAANEVIVSKPRLPTLIAPTIADPWLSTTQKKRDEAQAAIDLIHSGLQFMAQGVSANKVALMLIARYEADNLTPLQRTALGVLGKFPAIATLKRWLGAYQKHGRNGLLDNRAGRQRLDYGWEARAVELYNLPSKPDAGGVADWLKREGHTTAKHRLVKAYLDGLSALYTRNSPQRMGEHLHRLTQQAYQPRDKDGYPVGNVYAGDGHCIDCYVAHHVTGNITRYELTLFIDIRSLYVTGWYLSESESALNTMLALSKALVNHDHIPTFIYIDRGAGWKAKMLNEETSGWYQKLGIEVIAALPRNPHGKSWVERFFREIRDKHDKFFAGGDFYCGHDMADEVKQRVTRETRAGRLKLPTIYDYADSLNKWIDAHHQKPSAVLDKQSPAQLWAGFERFPVGDTVDVIMRPAEVKKVRRNMIRIHGRLYFHEDLAHYQDRKTELIVEYDIHDDRCIWVYTSSKRLICVAALVTKARQLSESRIKDATVVKEKKALQRLENHIQEVKARHAPAIDMDEVANRLEMPNFELLEPVRSKAKPHKPVTMVIDIDVD